MKKAYANEAAKLAAVYRCYAELLRLYYTDQKALTEPYPTVAQKIKRFLEQHYEAITTNYLNVCCQGSIKAAQKRVHISVHALGPFAFNEEWFIKGLKSLYLRGAQLKLPAFRKEYDYQSLFETCRKFEKRTKNAPVLSGVPTNKSDGTFLSKYYRDFPEQMEIFFLHYCYGLLHDELHEQILADIPLIDTVADLDKLIREVDKILPN